MHYPWWYVPHMTAPMLIAAIAVIHVLVSHFAVGGGIILAIETTHAYRTKNTDYLAYLKRYARFFILLTVVFGAVTGVGIWWVIGLASPLATEMLIRTFVFGWAIEWVFFIIELIAAFLFYYYWGRLDSKTHIMLVWVYAIAAWISLVLIAAITAFMLNSRGLIGDWSASGSFWHAMLNLQFIPQTIVRTGGALLISSLYVFVHASWTLKPGDVKVMLQRRTANIALVGVLIVFAGAGLWFMNLPPSARLVLEAAAVMNMFMGIMVASGLVCILLILVGPWRNPDWMTPGFAAALMLFGVAMFASAEFIRETIRKPYIVNRVILGNQIFEEQVPKLHETGYLEGGLWTKPWVERNYPQLIDDVTGKVDTTRIRQLTAGEKIDVGSVMFQYHCNDCHAIEHGYSSAGPLLTGRSPEMIRRLVGSLHEEHFYMPPWCGKPGEADALTGYLVSIRPEMPDPIPSSDVKNRIITGDQNDAAR